MSIKVSVYVPALSADLMPMIAARFAAFGMDCQFHPRYVLQPSTEPVMVPVRFRITAPNADAGAAHYNGDDMLSGFEISFKDFAYKSPLAVEPAANEALKRCTQVLTIRMQAQPTSALRLGLYFAVFLAELTGGIIYAPRSDKYLQPERALPQFQQDIESYESELAPQDWSVVPFKSW